MPRSTAPHVFLKAISALRTASVILALVIGSSLSASAQGLNEWTAHTSFAEGTGLSVSPTHVWVASSGGVYSVERSSGAISRLTVVSGLAGVGSSAIAVDTNRDLVWVGYDDGLLDRIDAASGQVRTFRDIQRADQFTARGINQIRVQGDSLFIATEFGVVVFDPERSEVRDSYTRIGSFPVAEAVKDIWIESDVLGARTLWVGTEEGVGRATMNGSNLQDPQNWIVEQTRPAGAAEAVYSVASLGGAMYAGTGEDVYQRNVNGNWDPIGVTNQAVTSLSPSGDVLVGSATFTVVVVRPGSVSSAHSIDDFPFPVAAEVSSDGSLWVIAEGSGLGSGSIPTEGSGNATLPVRYLPSGPADGTFADIQVASTGDIWLGGVNAQGTGFYRLDTEGEWTTWSSLVTPELAGRGAFVHVAPAAQGGGWAGSEEGGGVVRVEADDQLTVYTPSNSSLVGAGGFGDFVVVGGLEEDNLGNLWVTTRASSQPLHLRMSDGTWHGFGPKIGQGLLSTSTAYGEMFIDSFDEKWIIIRRETNFQQKRGLMVLETGIPENPSDDEFRFFGTQGAAGQGLPSISVNAIAEDRDGLIWVGTDSGPAFFINTGIVARDGSAVAIWPQWADRSLGTFMLFGLTIHDIAVDAAGRIWFGTNNGAWLVSSGEGGYDLIHHFTAANSPLFSDEVLGVDVDDRTGEVYFSTDRGLASYASDAIAPSEKAEDLVVFPNPVVLSGQSNPSVYIEGLVPAADIRIVTPAGYLVRRLESRGGRVRWDARDEEGQLVDSGVYLVIAVGRNDEGSAVGKIAVIR